MRIDKFIADSTAHSRKEIKKLIKYRAVTVNGVLCNNSDLQVGEDAIVTVNGKPVIYRKFIYLMLNKPQGYLSATEDKRDPVVINLVPETWQHFSVFPVGRLDKDTEGLLLLTNDGQFDHALMSPKKEITKRYYAELDIPAVPEDIALFAKGLDLGDFQARPAKLEITDDPHKVYIEISEGKFHQVKRMCEKTGKNVIFLKRTAIGPLSLDTNLPVGEMRELTAAELALFDF